MSRIYTTRPATTRFWAKVEQTDTCWLWQGYRDRKGYGHFKEGRDLYTLAHRFAYQERFGSVPSEIAVCHRCDVPACVRLEHLFTGTLADNNADMMAKGRHARGMTHGHARLTPVAVGEIRTSYQQGVLGYERLARIHGVGISTIRAVVKGWTWKGASNG